MNASKRSTLYRCTSSSTVGSALKAIGLASWQEDILSFGTIDSNYYASEDEGDSLVQATWYGNYDHYYSLSNWKSYSSYDTHSNTSNNINLNEVRFEFNPTDVSANIKLDYKYKDFYNTNYDNFELYN